MDKYVKKKQIGEGSFGKALLVKSKADGKEYVIKEINISKMKRKEREESKKEVSVLRKMKHPNIVSYQESFEADGNLYIVMDYCDGGDLYQAINRKRGVLFPEEQVMDWFVQICLALKHVHDRKILHRDIKSQNIFLTRKKIIKLGDFGIARVLNSTADLARTCIGTPYYLSPEICENKPYNNKSDVWALGCVLYEICTLKHAFEAGNMKNLVLKIIRGSYPPVSSRYSYDLRTLLNQLFKRNPRDRPSINTILKKPFIQRRIEKFLSETQVQDEFSHTVLHRNAPAAVAGVGRPVMSAVNKKPAYQPARISNPAAKYGPSVGMRKPQPAARRSAEREKRALHPDNKELEKKKQDLIERERERRNRDVQLRLQQQRLANKQRMQHINKAREVGWKHTLLSNGSNDSNEGDSKSNDEPPKKEPRIEAQQEKGNYQNYHDYLDKLQANQNVQPGHGGQVAFRKDNAGDAAMKQRIADRPVSASAAEAARRGHNARDQGAEAAGRAKMVEEFLLRKKQAAANKARGQAPWLAPSANEKPPSEGQVPYGGGHGGAMNIKGNNMEEQEYLDRLKAIRMQNYQQRRSVQQEIAGKGNAVRASLDSHDPRNNADARRKKIEALKAQAGQKAAKLKEQLEKQRGEAYAKEKRQWEEHLARKQGVKNKPHHRKGPAAPVIGLTGALHDVGIDVPVQPAAPVIGLTGVLHDVGIVHSELEVHEPSKSDISKAAAEAQRAAEQDRKRWASGGATVNKELANLPLQENTVDINDRRQWSGGETALGILGNLPIQLNTNTVIFVGKKQEIGDRKKWTGGETALNKLSDMPLQETTNEVDRKKWGGGDTALSNLTNLPLQETASIMEATGAQDLVIRNPDGTMSTRPSAGIGGGGIQPDLPEGGRRKWGGGKATSVVNVLGKADICSDTIVVKKKDEPKGPMGVTIVKKDDKPSPPQKLPIATGTITIAEADNNKKSTDNTDGGDIETIEIIEETSEDKDSPDNGEDTTKTAWESDNKSPRPPKSPKSPIAPTTASLEVKDTTVKRPRSPRSPRRRRELTKTEKKQEDSSEISQPQEETDSKELEQKDEQLPEKEGSKTPEKDDKDKKPKSPSTKASSPIQVATKEKTLNNQVVLQEEGDNTEDQDESNDDDEGGLFVGLTTGNFDTDARILRSCSMPDLSALFRTTLALNPFFEVENQVMVTAAMTLGMDMELQDLEDVDEIDGGGDGGGDDVLDDVDGEDREVEEMLNQSLDSSEDDDDDYHSLVESMQNVLEAADKADNADNDEVMDNDSPSPKTMSPVGGAEGGGDDEDDEDGTESKPVNEDWDSGSGNDSDEENQMSNDNDDTESVFGQLEETRLQLEEELGFDTFIKAYKTVQAIHGDEDEDMDEGTKIISGILGEEKDHLYTKILHLVMADGAYTEHND